MANNNPWTSDVILVMTAWVVTTYNSITSALSKARAMDKAAEILARMLKNVARERNNPTEKLILNMLNH
uniref:Uncharacterized protein n=1 Tax=Oryza glumipatula TaxID=40148 RepID=A0A0E0A9E3_9ORYZ